MKNQLSSVIVVVAVVALGAATWLLLPALQAPARAVDAHADRGSERARRILDKYNAETESVSAVFARSKIPDELGSDRIRELVENDSRTVRDILGEESDRLNRITKTSLARVRELDQRFAALEPGGELPARGSAHFGNNATDMSRSMAEGVQGRGALLRENAKLPADALSEVTESINFSKGPASGGDHLHALRIRGVVYYQQGMAAHRRAVLLRQDASAAMHEMTTTALRIRARRAVERLVEASGIVSSIERQAASVSEIERQLDDLTAQTTALGEKINILRKQIAEQLAIAEEARAQIDALEAQGLRYEDADALENFREQVQRHAAAYRGAVRLAQTYQSGTLANAHIAENGDYLTGRFVADSPASDIEYRRGLDEFERELAATGARREAVQELLTDARTALDRLRSVEAEYRSRAQKASDAAAKLTGLVQESFDKYTQLAQESAAAEDEALREFNRAARDFKKARDIARARVADVPTMSPEAEERSPNKLIKQDRWLAGQIQCQTADAQVRAALVLYDRYDHLKRAAAALRTVQEHAPLPGFDDGAIPEAIDETRQQAEDLLDEAITALERADRDIMHWTVAASLAGADYALALFDNPALIDVAIANYQAVIEDREDNPYVRPFLMRLEQLRNR